MSFQQALSGLTAASKNLDVIGNNVANVNTIGFKASRAEFADVFASTLAGSVSNSASGIGTRVATVSQSFSQGGITVSDRPLDVAINGEGFFRMDDNGSVVYSRNGQFKADAQGFLTNANGLKLTGYGVDANGNILTSSPVPLRLTVDTIDPRITKTASQGVNLDSRAASVGTTNAPLDDNPIANEPLDFNPDDTSTFTKATSMTVYDSLGNSHVMTTYYRKVQDQVALVNNQLEYSGDVKWEVYAAIDGKVTTGTPAASAVSSDADTADATTGLIGVLKFTSSGKPILNDPATSNFQPTLTIKGTGDPADVLNNGAADLEFSFDMSDSTQFGQSFALNSQDQDGYTSGELTGYSIGADGVVLARYSNTETRAQGQIVLATFKNPQGLSNLGGNNFAETANSGGPRVGEPGSSNIGQLQSGALEESNIDLTSELVNMITAQRAYQANSQTIKTQDSIMQTLVNLR